MVREAFPGPVSGFVVFGTKLSFGSKLATVHPDMIHMPVIPMNPIVFKKWKLIFLLDALILFLKFQTHRVI